MELRGGIVIGGDAALLVGEGSKEAAPEARGAAGGIDKGSEGSRTICPLAPWTRRQTSECDSTAAAILWNPAALASKA